MNNQSLNEASHPRLFQENRFVYPVLSRRSGGISVGINLNPDKACNFDCIYCQVDRSKSPQDRFVELPRLLQELKAVLTGLQPNGLLWKTPAFSGLDPNKMRVSDIAFSGDGEPTTFKNIEEILRSCVAIKETLGFEQAKVVIITNATGLNRPDVKEGLRFLDTHQGEVWAKLDAGSEEYFKLIDRTEFPFQQVLENILNCAKQRPVVIQSCFMRLRGQGPTETEISAYIKRLMDLQGSGALIKLVQIYTVARPPAYGIVSSLSTSALNDLATKVHQETKLPTETYHGEVEENQGLLGQEPSK